ncbi:MAG: type III pantothenate kinase [bacterium]
MNNLLIDIGNSDIKTAMSASGTTEVKLLKRFSYSKNEFEKDLKKNFTVTAGKTFDQIGISVLRNDNNRFLKEYFKKKYKITPQFITDKMELPVAINYSKGLGNDRICNAVAAYLIYARKDMLVIDFGTATTYTLINGNTLNGGLIAPGIKTSLSSLINNTSLPQVSLNFTKKLINTDTLNNIKAGVMFQSLFTAERVITELRKKYKGLYVISTGGYSKLISAKTKLINKTDSSLVLKGINLILSQ